MRKTVIAALACTALVAGCAVSETSVNSVEPVTGIDQKSTESQALERLLAYAKAQNSTGLIVVRDGETLVEEIWPAPRIRGFQLFLHGKTKSGALLEDVASQQKSFIAVLVAIAAEKGFIDEEKPVSEYLGVGWSRSTREQEDQILVKHILMMNSGLDDKFRYEAPAGTKFSYNTPVYAISKKMLAAATGQTLDELTRLWLMEPVGMNETAWRARPAALGNVGNNTGLVTSPGDLARFGKLIINGGVTENGERVLSEASISRMFERSSTNPAYGRLWWLNGGAYTLTGTGKRKDGSLIEAAPQDLVGAYGFLTRRLYLVPSQKLVVVRTGANPDDKQFDEQFWQRLNDLL